MSNCPKLGKDVTEVLTALPQLERLALRGHAWIDDDVARRCAALMSLVHLDLGSTVDRYPIPGDETLSGGVTKLTADGVAALAALTRLRELHLAAAQPLPVAALRALVPLLLRR